MTPEDRAREIANMALGEWDAEFLLQGKSAPSLVDLIEKHGAAAIREERSEAEERGQEQGIEAAAKLCEDRAFACRCSDDTMAGVYKAMPWERAARDIRLSAASRIVRAAREEESR